MIMNDALIRKYSAVESVKSCTIKLYSGFVQYRKNKLILY
jgi:hypothetical protein